MNQRMRGMLKTVLAGIAVSGTVAAGLVGVSSPAFAAGTPIGVLPSSNGVCPPGTTRGWIMLDNEDDETANAHEGWVGGVESARNTTFYLCQTDAAPFVALRNSRKVNFAVLALGPSCPSGSITLDRYFDDEDYQSTSEDTLPNDSATRNDGDNTYFRFCWFLNDDWQLPAATSFDFPDLHRSYGVFGAPGDVFGNPYLATGWVHTDDEDSDNQNKLTSVNDVQKIYLNMWLEANHNTTMRMGQVS